MKPIFVTTSWDDGHVLDMRLAQLLEKYGIKGTFYIAQKDHESPVEDRLTDEQIKELSHSFEIGAHTMTHARLPQLPASEADREIRASKEYLENATGSPVTSFCYPRGEYRKDHITLVRNAGFRYARTVKRGSVALNDPSLEARTTVNTYNHYSDLWSIARFAKWNPAEIVRLFQWHELAKARFDQVMKEGGVFHLWGHSWEIEAHGDWAKLEEVLAYIARKTGVRYVTNGEFAAARPRTVLITTPYFPPYSGGVQMYSYNIAKRLQNELGWTVRIATSGEKGGRIVEDEFDGLKVYRLPYFVKISNTPINPFWPFMLRKIIKNEEVSVINAHAPVPFMSDMTALAAGKTPLVLTYHTGSMRKKFILPNILIGIYESWPLHALLRRADFIVCPSDYVRLGFLKDYEYKSVTITPAVDSTIFKPGPRGDGPRTVLFVGGLTRSEQHKGLRVLLNAFVAVHGKHPDVRLRIVGEGNMRKEYAEEARKMGLGDVVAFAGRLSRDDLVKAYQQCDIFVLPSTSPAESFGMVLVEAMASGKAVVGSNAGGIPCVIDHERTGLLTESENVKSVADALTRLLGDPAFAGRLAEAGKVKALTQFDWPSKSAAYDDLFKKF